VRDRDVSFKPRLRAGDFKILFQEVRDGIVRSKRSLRPLSENEREETQQPEGKTVFKTPP